jgi:hypothetical protein
MQEYDHLPVESLNLSRRTYHALVRSRILTIGDLRQFFINKNKYQIRNIGAKSLDEISKALEELPSNTSLLSHLEEKPVLSHFHEDKSVGKSLQSPIDVLHLPVAINDILKNHGIRTIEDLRKTPNSKLLKINLISSKQLKEINRLLDKFVNNLGMIAISESVTEGNESVMIVNEPLEAVEKKVITWSQVIEDYFRNEKEVYTYILISRFGFSPKTLEEIAANLGVTRERVRQIQEAVAVRYLNHLRFSGAIGFLEKIEQVFAAHRDRLSLSTFNATLKKERVLGQFSEPFTTEHIKNIDLLETMICWLNLISNKKYTLRPIEFSVNISDLTKSGKISIRDHAILKNISKKEKREIKRKVLFTGGITVKEATRILLKDERIIILLLKKLNLQKIDDEWFTFKNLTDDHDNSKIPLRIAGLKMLAVNPTMSFDSFHDGLRRHASRFYSSIAPIHVVERVLPLLGFEIKDSKVSTQLSVKGILSKSEECLVNAIRKNDGIASFLEIAEEFFLQSLSLAAVSVTLKRSPIAEKVNDGFHKLRGADISWQHIDDAKNRQKRFSQDDAVTHGLDGVVRLKFTVNSYAFLTGVIGANSVKELWGSWSVVHEGKPYSEAKLDEVYLWGLAKLFKKLDVKMGERMELAFNTWDRTLSVRRIGNENP